MAPRQILAQAIDATGGIDPSWVLSGITVMAAFLLWNQIKDIKTILKGVVDLLQLHDRDIAVMKHQLKGLDKRVKESDDKD